MKQDQVVAVEVSNSITKRVPGQLADRSTTDLSQSIRIEQQSIDSHFEPDSGADQSPTFRDTLIRVEFLGKIHLSHTHDTGPKRPAYKTRDGHTLH